MHQVFEIVNSKFGNAKLRPICGFHLSISRLFLNFSVFAFMTFIRRQPSNLIPTTKPFNRTTSHILSLHYELFLNYFLIIANYLFYDLKPGW